MRKLASIRKINELIPIEGADNIEIARIYGWNAIVQKGLHNLDDKIVFFEIDSLLPIKEEYEFLRPRCYVKNPEGFRIKTMKLRGVVSQGLIMPYDGDGQVGDDVTEEYGVVLYEKPTAYLPAHIKGHWPEYIAKTDQERVQNLAVPRSTTYEITLKLDGTSETVYFYNDEVGVCSRNYKLEPEGTYWIAATDIMAALSQYKKNIAIQGELMGPKIQGNPLGLKEPEIFIFDIWDIDDQRYLFPDERRHMLDELNEFVGGRIKHVPEIGDYTPAECYDDEQHLREEIIAMADITFDGRIQEGIVLKSYDMPFTFKAINNRYLLKEK